MSNAIEDFSNKASDEEIAEHLWRCDADFVPPLCGRINIKDYAKKIVGKATRFESWAGRTLVRLVAAYCNDQDTRIAYITSVSVLPEWAGKGIALQLMSRCIDYARTSGMKQISLEVAIDNMRAIRLYEKSGFIAGKENAPFILMNLNLTGGEEHEQPA
jgi:GNAT superfamily N-acetyltransferase